MSEETGPPAQPSDATRRTYLANERTLLAWWRTGLAAFAVAIAIGRPYPCCLTCRRRRSSPSALGSASSALRSWVLGARRDRTITRALAAGRFAPLDGRVVWGVTVAMCLLGLITLILLVFEA